jgi:hypothetical protein
MQGAIRSRGGLAFPKNPTEQMHAASLAPIPIY